MRDAHVLPPAGDDDADSARASSPWVVEDHNGILRMWYSGHDGLNARILGAIKEPAGPWRRLGTIIEPGFAGATDGFGIESPCVVTTPAGYLMIYGGSDGEVTRLHMATSSDGSRWTPQGTIMQRGSDDAIEATDPCLVVTASKWWLFYSGYAGANGASRVSILGAVSSSGASWDRMGTILNSPAGARISHPCVVDVSRTYYMFHDYVDRTGSRIAMATSGDGASWASRGVTLVAAGSGADAFSVHAPCVVRLRDGTVRMWYAGLPSGDERLDYRICSATFSGRWPL